MKKAFIDIREIFWPLLEENLEDSDGNGESDVLPELKISDDNLEEAFKLNLKVFENEEDRRKGIESKATLYISTISLVTSIVVAANALITGNQDYSIPIKISVIISFILSIYAVRTVWFSIKAIERGAYSVLDINDTNIAGKKSHYYKQLINSLQKKILWNQSKINKKVDYFTLAQEYYKRAIIIILIYSFMILLFCLFSKKPIKSQVPMRINNIKAATK